MIQILILVITMLAKSEGTYNQIYDIQQIDKTHHYYGQSINFEDGSYVSGNFTGCTPFRICSNIQIDSPWEDYFSFDNAQILYDLEAIYKLFNHN